MSKLGALVEHVRKAAQEIRLMNPEDSRITETLARLEEHAEDVYALSDESQGVGA